MEIKDRRRKSKRHPAHWEVAVVFDKPDGEPVLQTQTEDLSIGGAAIRSHYGDLTGSLVTLFLALPVRRSAEAPKLLKIRARVVSSMQSPGVSGFRHGLSFVRSDDDGLDILAELLGGAEPEAKPAAPAGGGRLAQLKQLALAKQLEEKTYGQGEIQEEIQARVSRALEKAYWYLKEFTEQLNIVKPAYAKAYSIVGVPTFDGLTWKNGRVDLRTRVTQSTTKLFEQVMLYFQLSANKQLRAVRESPAHEKLKQMLLETKIEFTTQEERNERGYIIRTTFVIPCEIRASLLLIGNFDTGKLLLKANNIGRFGMLEHLLAPEAITQESLDELTGFILGESSQIGPLILKDA